MVSVLGTPNAEGFLFRSATADDMSFVITLWKVCHLLRPWNDPADDIRFCLQSPASELLLAVKRGSDRWQHNDGERRSPGLGLLPRCFAGLAARRHWPGTNGAGGTMDV